MSAKTHHQPAQVQPVKALADLTPAKEAVLHEGRVAGDRVVTPASFNYNQPYTNVYGTTGADNLHGTSGQDIIFGGGGDDTIEAGDGDDLIYAGNGNDYVNSISGGDDEFHGGHGDDYYYGFTGNEKIFGDAGNDTLKGYSGDDTLEGGIGADKLDGGSGWDTASYSGALSGVYVSLEYGAGYLGDSEGDTLTNIESLTGSSFADYLYGDNNGNVLDGAAGDDALYGNGGWDNIYGGEGNDYIEGGAGSDYMQGGNGNDKFKQVAFQSDYINGGDGIDTIDYSTVAKQYWAWDDGIEVDLEDNYAGYSRSGGHAGQNTGTDTVVGIENVIGTKWNDRLFGDDKNNTFTSGGGSDDLEGRGGNDTFVMTPGTKGFVDGGTGIDTIDYSAQTISVILTLDGSYDGNYGAAADTRVRDVENVIGSKVGDSIFGNGANNQINGMAGDDWIKGGYGGDVLTGGSGKDEFRYSALSDSINDTNWGLRDRITDFTHGQDHIDVWQIDARDNVSGNQSFSFVGNNAFTGTGQIRSYFDGNKTMVEFNTSDAAGAEMVIELDGHVNLDAYDFVL